MKTDVLFVSPMCLLDSGSGAALSVRTWLELLSAEGYRCESITMAVFDGMHEYQLQRFMPRGVLKSENQGKLLQISYHGVRHSIFYTHSTVGANITGDERNRFLSNVVALMDKKQPEIIISYGSSDYTRKLQALARQRCRRFIFYLANAGFTRRELFTPEDIVVCPSDFLAAHYRCTLNLDPCVVRTVIKTENTIGEGAGISSQVESREFGFVTYINPQPDKGLTLFLRLTQMAWIEHPNISFLAVEGRVSREHLQKIGVDLAVMPNVWWLPNQNDIRRVYARTSLLLCPSFCLEAAWRIIAEAQLSGIPVLAANRGGIPEQMNGGGFLFDIPERCTENYRIIPTEAEVRPWLDTIGRLMENDTDYARASETAIAAGKPFLYERRKKAVIRFFDKVLNDERS